MRGFLTGHRVTVSLAWQSEGRGFEKKTVNTLLIHKAVAVGHLYLKRLDADNAEVKGPAEEAGSEWSWDPFDPINLYIGDI